MQFFLSPIGPRKASPFLSLSFSCQSRSSTRSNKKADDVGHVRWWWRQESSGRFVRVTQTELKILGTSSLARKNTIPTVFFQLGQLSTYNFGVYIISEYICYKVHGDSFRSQRSRGLFNTDFLLPRIFRNDLPGFQRQKKVNHSIAASFFCFPIFVFCRRFFFPQEFRKAVLAREQGRSGWARNEGWKSLENRMRF